jgi:hypothetical protein
MNYYLVWTNMKKPTITDDLTKSEKKGAIEAAAAGGMKPGELFAAVVEGYYGVGERRGLVVHWGRKMSLPPSDALQIAHVAGLIPMSQQTLLATQEKLQRNSAGKTSA